MPRKQLERSLAGRKKRRPMTPKGRLKMRLNEVGRLTAFLSENGVMIDRMAFGIVVADAQAQLERDLDILTFKPEHWGIELSEEERLSAIHRACRYRAARPQHRGMSDKTAGKLIKLSRFDRDECRITTMEAVDDCRATRARRKAEARAERERERGRARRRKAGAVPRAEYLAKSLSRSKPWEDEGVSRMTWYRRRKAKGRVTGPSTCIDNIYIAVRTDL